jgi:two-component system chemotaxis sensor kinase CheA
VVAVRLGERQVGIVVSSLVGEQEVVIKSLSRALGDVRGVSGATILGDGQVALIVDVPSLLNQVVAIR